MATETPTRTHCPTCGAKITRQHLSLCAYCGTPLGIEPRGAKPRDHATLRRLTQMKSHEEYAAAIAWRPPPTEEVRRARSRLALAGAIAAAGAAALASAAFAPGARPFVLAAGALLALAIALAIPAWRSIRRDRSLPTLHRAAIVTSRRSETDMRGGRTIYFFDLEFEDGSGGEFRYPGRGAAYDPLVPGATGVAYTRREELLAFRTIRV